MDFLKKRGRPKRRTEVPQTDPRTPVPVVPPKQFPEYVPAPGETQQQPAQEEEQINAKQLANEVLDVILSNPDPEEYESLYDFHYRRERIKRTTGGQQ